MITQLGNLYTIIGGSEGVPMVCVEMVHQSYAQAPINIFCTEAAWLGGVDVADTHVMEPVEW